MNRRLKKLYVSVRNLIPIHSIRALPAEIVNYLKSIPLIFRVFLNHKRTEYPTVIYVGDSHSYAFCCPAAPKWEWIESLVKVGYREHLCWIGPRLMYSLGKKGIPSKTVEEIRKLSRTEKNLLLVWFLGEIDIRVFGKTHYSGKVENIQRTTYGFLKRLSTDLSEFHHFITIPTAQSAFGKDDPDFPRVGSLEERMSVFELFKDEISNNTRFPVFDPNQFLRDKVLSPEESIDGVHFNFDYSLRARRALHRCIYRRATKKHET